MSYSQHRVNQPKVVGQKGIHIDCDVNVFKRFYFHDSFSEGLSQLTSKERY